MQEIRHLVFNRQELQEIAYGFLDDRGERPSASGSIWELGGERDGVRLTLVPAANRSGEQSPKILRGGELLSAAILFCKRRRVPLPVRGQKEIGIMRGSLSLVITMCLGE